jgi:hypothetical protein
MLKTLLLTALFATATAAFGEESGIPDEIDLAHARALHEQARDLRSRAEADFSAAEPACYQRFLVNRCLDAARALRLDRIREARALEIRARRIELADRQRRAAEAGMPTQVERSEHAIPTPTEISAPPPNDAAEAVRARRAAEAERAEARARAEQAQRDAERQQTRERAEAAAARRAEQAERDRERYDERIRKREEALSQ